MHGPFRAGKEKSATSAQLLKKNSKMQKTKARLSIFSKAEKAEKLRIFFSRSATRKRNFMAGAHHNIDIITVAEREGELRH